MLDSFIFSILSILQLEISSSLACRLKLLPLSFPGDQTPPFSRLSGRLPAAP